MSENQSLLFLAIEVEMDRPLNSKENSNSRMSTLRHKYSQIKQQIDSQKETLNGLNQNLADFKNGSTAIV